MRKIIISIIIFALHTLVAFAQNVDFTKSNFSKIEDGLKEALSNIKKGDDFYRAGPEQYSRALEYYIKANDFNPENALLNYKIGTCYLFSSFKPKAVTYLEKAKTLNPDVDNKIYYYLGRAYHLNMEWNTAIDLFEAYKKRVAGTEEEKLLDADKKIQECRNGIELMKDTLRFSKLPDSLRYRIENLGPEVNSEYGDYHPVISADESVLFFTARRSNTTGGGISDDGKYFEDVYVSNNENSKWTEAKNLGEPISRSNQHDATCGLSVDGQTLFIYVDDMQDGTGNIYECKLDGRVWAAPKKLPKVISTRYHESSASLAPDGRTLYFCSQNPLDNKGLGEHDIFRSKLVTLEGGKTEWSEPENLGQVINTIYDERTVFIHPDGKTLYFSTEGHNSMGGYDLFKAVYNDSLKKWSKPVNLGYPINSPDNDADFVVSASGKHAYYATIRPDGLGDKDIYKITFPADTTPQLTLVKGNVTDESKNVVAAKIEIIDNKTGKVISTQVSNSATGKFLVSLPSGKNYKMNITADGYYAQQQNFNIPKGEKFKELEVNVIMKRKVQMVSIEGEITDENSKPLGATIEIINNATGEVILKTTADKLGKYLSKLQAGKNYGMVVSADGYLFESLNLDIPPDKDKMKLPPIRLKKIEAGKNIVLNNIFFDFDRATLRPDSKPELDRVAKVLKDNPSMKIELSGHTDSKGSATYNLKLSEARAKSVVDYLINSGIAKNSLAFKGYGFLKPIASNDTEAGRQQNRRTEFKVLEIDTNAKVNFTSPKPEVTASAVKKMPENVLKADKNNDGKISADEITLAIDGFFDGDNDFTVEKINGLIDFFFEQE
jgi:outer membrane protein OmpA-like peptidoglycan-associated protein/tetratricopeptide (TPR) repeat protein/YHS domain-containing protein